MSHFKTIPHEIAQTWGFKITDKSAGNSFTMGLLFYETHMPDCFITNYNVLASDEEDPDLTKKDMVLIYGTRITEKGKLFNSMFISNQTLADKGQMDNIFQEFEAGFGV